MAGPDKKKLASLMSDPELLRACVSRREGAWDEFIDRFAKLIYYSIHRSLATRRGKVTPEEIEDLFNDVVVHLIKDDCRKLRLFRGEGGCSPATWIRTITVRFVIDFLRSKARSGERVDIEVEGVAFELSLQNPVTRPDEVYEELEEDRRYRAAVETLGENDRYFMDLYYTKGLAPDKVAKTMGISVKTVYSRINRIKNKLGEEVERQGRK